MYTVHCTGWLTYLKTINLFFCFGLYALMSLKLLNTRRKKKLAAKRNKFYFRYLGAEFFTITKRFSPANEGKKIY